MALSTLLEIITRVADELVIDRPSAVIGSTAPQVRTLLACANAAGRDLMRAHEWGALQTTATITTSNGTSSYPLEADFDRIVSDTGWDRTNQFMMKGPDSPQINRYLNESGVAQASINKRFRLQGSNIIIWPTPTTAETLVYEYISSKWARSEANVAQTEFAADADTTVFDPDLLKAEIKWRFMAARGLYAEALKGEADNIRATKIASDIGGTSLNLAPNEASQFVDLANVPDSGWSL